MTRIQQKQMEMTRFSSSFLTNEHIHPETLQGWCETIQKQDKQGVTEFLKAIRKYMKSSAERQSIMNSVWAGQK